MIKKYIKKCEMYSMIISILMIVLSLCLIFKPVKSIETFVLLFFSIGGKSMFWKCRRRRFYKQLAARIEKRLSDLFWIDRNFVGLFLSETLHYFSIKISRHLKI